MITTLSRQEKIQEGTTFIRGRVNESLMDKVLEGSYENKTFMTCGPTALMNMVVKHLTSNGVEEKHIKQESFE